MPKALILSGNRSRYFALGLQNPRTSIIIGINYTDYNYRQNYHKNSPWQDFPLAQAYTSEVGSVIGALTTVPEYCHACMFVL